MVILFLFFVNIGEIRIVHPQIFSLTQLSEWLGRKTHLSVELTHLPLPSSLAGVRHVCQQNDPTKVY